MNFLKPIFKSINLNNKNFIKFYFSQHPISAVVEINEELSEVLIN